MAIVGFLMFPIKIVVFRCQVKDYQRVTESASNPSASARAVDDDSAIVLARQDKQAKQPSMF